MVSVLVYLEVTYHFSNPPTSVPPEASPTEATVRVACDTVSPLWEVLGVFRPPPSFLRLSLLLRICSGHLPVNLVKLVLCSLDFLDKLFVVNAFFALHTIPQLAKSLVIKGFLQLKK